MNRIKIILAGKEYAIQTEESVSYVKQLAESLNTKIEEFMQQNEALSMTSASMLVALGLMDDCIKAASDKDNLRKQGIKAGLLKVRVFRPFPGEEIAKALSHVKAIAILDRADSLNAAGGALFEDVTSGMYVNNIHVPAVNYVYGLGGRDTKSDDIESVFQDLLEIVNTGKIDNPYRYLGLRKGGNQ